MGAQHVASAITELEGKRRALPVFNYDIGVMTNGVNASQPFDDLRPQIKIGQAKTPREIALSRSLFEEYAAGISVDLSFQGFATELAGLPGLYSPPKGRLLLALAGEEAAGCIALRPLDGTVCELKRLFVRPSFRGRGLGERLAQRIVEEARIIGYRTIRLDTLPSMHAAIQVYQTVGFQRCAAYYQTPLHGTVFMELEL
jgi:GNAT superfamily N-acetyltransferase